MAWGGQVTIGDASLSPWGDSWEEVSPQGTASCFTWSRGWIRCGHVRVMPKTTLNQKDKITSICLFINYRLVRCTGEGSDVEIIIFLYYQVFGVCLSVCECLGETVEEINNAEVQIWTLCINEIWVWPLTTLRINAQPFLSGKSNRGHNLQKINEIF